MILDYYGRSGKRWSTKKTLTGNRAKKWDLIFWVRAHSLALASKREQCIDEQIILLTPSIKPEAKQLNYLRNKINTGRGYWQIQDTDQLCSCLEYKLNKISMKGKHRSSVYSSFHWGEGTRRTIVWKVQNFRFIRKINKRWSAGKVQNFRFIRKINKRWSAGKVSL